MKPEFRAFFILTKTIRIIYRKRIMYHRNKIYLLIFLLFSNLLIIAQSQVNDTKFKRKSFGVSLGLYNPELDYWKNNPNSVFLKAEYDQNFFTHGFAEARIIGNLTGKVGLGYWQQRAVRTIPKFGKTTMLLTGIPVTLDLIYYAEPISVLIFTPFAGFGGELLFIEYSLDFKNKENPDPVSGVSALGTGIFGLQSKLSNHFSIDFLVEYKIGNYEQDFVEEVESSDPNFPNSTRLVTEKISLEGLKYGFSLKYIF